MKRAKYIFCKNKECIDFTFMISFLSLLFFAVEFLRTFHVVPLNIGN